MRTIIAAAILLIAACGTSVAQNSDQWSEWITRQNKIVQVKVDAIKEGTLYRDQVCPNQKVEAAKTDCIIRLDKILDGFKKQEDLGLAMVAVATKLPNERMILLSIVQPTFDKMNDETSALVRETFAMYPRRQASTGQQ